MLFIILYYLPNPPTLRVLEAVTIFHPHLKALGPSRFRSKRRVGSSLFLLLRSYLNLLSISQIGDQWSDWSPRGITPLSWFYHPLGRQSRPARPSRSSLDSTLFRSLTIKKDWPLIEDWWQKADIDILRVGFLTASSQPSSFRFTHDFFNDWELFSLKHRIGKALVLL